jgi:hypothetical protein
VRLVDAHDEAAAAVGGVDGRARGEAGVLLAAPGEGRLGGVDRAVARVEDERAGLLGQRQRVAGARAHRDPLGAELGGLEVVALRAVLAAALERDGLHHGQPSTQRTGVRKVSRPSTIRAGFATWPSAR